MGPLFEARRFVTIAAFAAGFMLASCGEGVTPVCTPDASCGPKPPTDGGTSASSVPIP